ncbi:MAG: response regulator [Nitrospiraceae bacterium]|nr:MAG: response regulator [Nitrospiraceae bacterium]
MTERILIIDNDPEMLNLLNILVSEETSYEPVITNNPFEAVEIIRGGGIALVITKLKMPGLDGIQILQETKRADEDIQVIIISKYSTFEAARELMNNDGFDLLEIPFKKEQMLLAINKSMNWRKLHKDYRELKECFKGSKSRPSAVSGAV